MIKKKAQSGIEFVILLGAALFFMLGFVAVISYYDYQKKAEASSVEAREYARIVQDEIKFAHNSVDGYQRYFYVPNDIAGIDFDIQLDCDGNEVYLHTTDGRIALALSVLESSGDVVVGENFIEKTDGEVILNGGITPPGC